MIVYISIAAAGGLGSLVLRELAKIFDF